MAYDKTKIRQEIEKKITETTTLIASLKEQSKPVEPDNAIGRLTRMDAIQQKNMSEANLRAAEERVLLLKETLHKLEEESFGICVKCNEPIPVERILIMPESRLCVKCAS